MLQGATGAQGAILGLRMHTIGTGAQGAGSSGCYWGSHRYWCSGATGAQGDSQGATCPIRLGLGCSGELWAHIKFREPWCFKVQLVLWRTGAQGATGLRVPQVLKVLQGLIESTRCYRSSIVSVPKELLALQGATGAQGATGKCLPVLMIMILLGLREPRAQGGAEGSLEPKVMLVMTGGASGSYRFS